MMKPILHKTFCCLSRLAYRMIVPSILSSAFITFIFKMTLTIGTVSNDDENSDGDSDEELDEYMIIFNISAPEII